MKHRNLLGLFASFVLLIAPSFLFAEDDVIKLGISSSTSGSYANVGISTKNAAELAKGVVKAGGGVRINEKTYTLEFVYVDNASNRSTAEANALKMITQDKVIAIVGPQSSDRAIAVGEVANAFKIPMITPWSSSPLTTLNKPFVFRMSMMYDIQAVATTKFAAKEWKATKVAVLYDEISPYPSGMAKTFKKVFEETNGAGSVVAFESFRTGDTDFTKQIRKIIISGADFLYTPQYYDEIPLIVRQSRNSGWKKPITGSNSWSGGDLMSICGYDCKGLFFTGNFAPGGAKGRAAAFVDQFEKIYKKLPDETAALTYDAVNLIIQALQATGGLTGNLLADRISLRNKIASVMSFNGVTGTLGYHGTGDPAKCAVLIKIDDNGIFTTQETVCP